MRTGLSAKAPRASDAKIIDAAKRTRSFFIIYSLPSSFLGNVHRRPRPFRDKKRPPGRRPQIVRLYPSFPNTGGTPVSRNTLRPGSIGEWPAATLARRLIHKLAYTDLVGNEDAIGYRKMCYRVSAGKECCFGLTDCQGQPLSASAFIKKERGFMKDRCSERENSGNRPAMMSECGITHPEVPPIYATSVFSFDTLEDIDAVYEGEKPGYVYSRMANPTVTVLEQKLAAIEGVERAVAFSSGMAAISTSLLSILEPGDHILVSDVLYGGTYTFLSEFLPSWGVETEFLHDLNPERLASCFRKNTKALYIETISNPLMEVADIPKLSDTAKKHGCLVMVDNTFASPALCRPVEEGADIVLESLTKYLNGHSDVTGGMAGGPGQSMAKVEKLRSLMGGSMSPFDAWLTARGLRTFDIRMEKHAENALFIARKLQKHSAVRRVFYPGLESHESYGIARKLLRKGFGGMLSFEVEGGEQGVSRLVRRLEKVELLPSLAALSTTISHPAKTSHRSVPHDRREDSGITTGLVRLSAGIESPDAVWQDLENALDGMTSD